MISSLRINLDAQNCKPENIPSNITGTLFIHNTLDKMVLCKCMTPPSATHTESIVIIDCLFV